MTFVIRNIRHSDTQMRDRAEAFLLQHPDPGVRVRPADQLDKAIEVGQGIAILQNDEICGLSMVYKFANDPSDTMYSEIGTMRIIANGHGLQEFVAKFHLLQIFNEEYDEFELPNVFAVVSPGETSAYVLTEKVGMLEWTPPTALEVARSNASLPFNPEKQALIAERSTFSRALADLRKWHERDNVFDCPKGGVDLRVELNWFFPQILEISV